MLVVWQFEECPYCQELRARLTELRLDFIAINAPRGAEEKDSVMLKLFDSVKVPALWDTQTGALKGPSECLDYLNETYG